MAEARQPCVRELYDIPSFLRGTATMRLVMLGVRSYERLGGRGAGEFRTSHPLPPLRRAMPVVAVSVSGECASTRRTQNADKALRRCPLREVRNHPENWTAVDSGQPVHVSA